MHSRPVCRAKLGTAWAMLHGQSTATTAHAAPWPAREVFIVAVPCAHMPPRRPSVVVVRPVVPVFARCHVDPAVEPVLLIARSGREEQRVDRLVREPVAERESPQPIDLDWAMVD